MKPDWDDAPEWAQWLCCDSDLIWHWFEFKPHLVTNKLGFVYWKRDSGKCECYSRVVYAEDSLEQRQ